MERSIANVASYQNVYIEGVWVMEWNATLEMEGMTKTKHREIRERELNVNLIKFDKNVNATRYRCTALEIEAQGIPGTHLALNTPTRRGMRNK